MFNVGGSEMVVLAILALLVFGPESLPGIIKNVMRTINAVKTAARDFQSEVNTALQQENERRDLAQRQRKPFEEPPQIAGDAAVPTEAVAPQPDASEEIAGEVDAVDAVDERAQETTPAEGPQTEPVAETEQASEGADNEIAPESEAGIEEDPEDSEAPPEPEIDDDGPRIPMGRLRRPEPEQVEEVTETT